MAALAPKALAGGEDAIWAHDGLLHSENITHQLDYLWRGAG